MHCQMGAGLRDDDNFHALIGYADSAELAAGSTLAPLGAISRMQQAFSLSMFSSTALSRAAALFTRSTD